MGRMRSRSQSQITFLVEAHGSPCSVAAEDAPLPVLEHPGVVALVAIFSVKRHGMTASLCCGRNNEPKQTKQDHTS